MGLTLDFLDQHIHKWEQRLATAAYPHRARWPQFLFHHSPLQNALRILRDDLLLSRIDSGGKRVLDVAGAGVIDNRDDAHRFVRFYFRPRTPTQYYIEGVRKPADCRQFGEQAHAPVLIMFVVDSRHVLSLADTRFSDRNMQRGEAAPGNNDEYFAGIPFDKVYHEGGIAGDSSITAHRCAEVLGPSPMRLSDCLRWIYCRSEAEKQTLQYLLEEQAPKWAPKMIVSDDLRVFQKEFVFVNDVNLSPEGVVFRLNPRRDMLNVGIKIQCWNSKNQQILDFINTDFRATPPEGQYWRARVKLPKGNYRVRIDLENQLAFEGPLTRGDTLL